MRRLMSCLLTLSLALWALAIPLQTHQLTVQDDGELSSSLSSPSADFAWLEESKALLAANVTFDMINMTSTANKTLTDLPLIHFERFEVVNTSAAVDAGFLQRGDMNCATSPPNAIRNTLGHRAPGPSIFRSNATSLAARNISEFFDLRGFSVKPLGPAQPNMLVSLQAWEIHERTPKNVYSLFIGWGPQSGFLRPVVIQPARYFPGFGKRVNWVEIEAITVEGKPWPFCMDDLLLDFYEKNNERDDAGEEVFNEMPGPVITWDTPY